MSWWEGLTEWTPGDAGASSTVLNVPVEWVDEALWFGASAALVHADPVDLLQAEAWRRFEDLLLRVRGANDPDDGAWVPDPADYV